MYQKNNPGQPARGAHVGRQTLMGKGNAMPNELRPIETDLFFYPFRRAMAGSRKNGMHLAIIKDNDLFQNNRFG
ncbi:hypothetical protein DSCO28_35840 [Desulfosarcina ovata subsp. sediminis]|uniref:Uncharacterized protein n=1 Tax=Desulfosarcina ovata subsp. sediminis TaxID=885957 RepID=A0A5K7ZS30_9BACT|nr:hypothetical protein [Desulfosarcina ovata]BBO83018.1 hypothetical protein DSCO28_35840 [Desulfosarcina ovata subsp. sediminis]